MYEKEIHLSIKCLNRSTSLMETIPESISLTRSGKRIVQKSKWKRNVAKEQRHSPKLLPVLPKCTHSKNAFRCSSLQMSDIVEFHKQFYATTSKLEQDAFLMRHCTISVTCKRRRPTTETNKPKVFNIKCNIRNTNNLIVPVCQAAFLKVLHITKHRLQYAMKHFAAKATSPKENRGGDHTSIAYKHKKEAVINFIKRFKFVEAGYTDSAKFPSGYLPSDLNVKKMVNMYNAETQDENLKVKKSFFRNVFNKSFNLCFATPRTDVHTIGLL